MDSKVDSTDPHAWVAQPPILALDKQGSRARVRFVGEHESGYTPDQARLRSPSMPTRYDPSGKESDASRTAAANAVGQLVALSQRAPSTADSSSKPDTLRSV